MGFTWRGGQQLDPGFEQFVLDRSSALLRTAVLLVGDRGHAEDLVQTTMLRTALKWRNAKANPEAYARRVLINLVRDRWRRSSRRVAEQSLDERTPVPTTRRDHAETVVDREVIQRALSALPQRQREVVVLRFFADLSVAETAAAVRTSEGTVKAYTSRALVRLRCALDQYAALDEDAADDISEADHVQ